LSLQGAYARFLSSLQGAYARFFVILASGEAAQRESSELRLRRNFATADARRWRLARLCYAAMRRLFAAAELRCAQSTGFSAFGQE
jgi:hypothetical protein